VLFCFLVPNIVTETKNRKEGIMTIRLEGLTPDYRKELQIMMEEQCLDGECYTFAIALSRGLGWSIIGLMKKKNVVRHVVLIDHNGKYWDARGPITEDEIGEPFGILPPYNFKPIAEEDIISNRPVSEIDIDSISKKAQAIWPDLPWRKNTLKPRAIAFAADLERISKKHKLWVCGSIQRSLPMITEGEEDEVGYVIRINLDGSYTINCVIGG